ncbi:MAG: GAF domain-containing protein [Alphaproteobacteria bacterium]|nr:GAF domain-containing protein [Alphaproteobacteria bacterium]
MKRGLFLKYVVLFVGLVTGVLVINAALDLYFVYQDNRRASIEVQKEKAEAAAQRIESFVRNIENQIGWVTQAQWSGLPLDQRRFDYVRLLRQVPAITELVQLDRQGREQLRVSRLSMDVLGSGTDRSQEPAFVEAMANRVYFSPVYFRKESEPYLTMAVAHGSKSGVTIAEVNLKLIWDVVSQIKVGNEGYAYIVDRQGRLVGHPDISLVLRGTDMSRLAQVATALKGEAIGTLDARNRAGTSVLSAYATIPALNWLVFVEVPTAEAQQPVINAGLRALALLVLGLAIAGLAGALLARRMVVPIRTLQAGAERIGGGDLGHRLAIKTGDELESLAAQFNRSASALQDSYATLEQRVVDRTRELSEALDQQTATAEVLQAINASGGDLKPVFDIMVRKAKALCDAPYGNLITFDGEYLTAVSSMQDAPAGMTEFWKIPHRLDPSMALAQALHDGRALQFPDLAQSESYRRRIPITVALVEQGGIRTFLQVPLVSERGPLGVFIIYRQEVRPFTDKQVALVETFAAQAVIAMENARLLGELRETLEQQTATAEVLRVISQSPTDVQPVLDAVAAAARRFCGGEDVTIVLREGPELVQVAHDGELALIDAGRFPLDRSSTIGHTTIEARTIHVPDVAALAPSEYSLTQAVSQEVGVRAILAAPMLREGGAIGCILLRKPEPGPFTPRQVELLQTFAAQAVIAIENVRLFTELDARNQELRESLEYQTAISDVLKVMSRSTFDLEPVLQTVLETAVRLCHAQMASIFQLEGGAYRWKVGHGLDPRYQAREASHPILPGRGTLVGRVAASGQAVRVMDALNDPEYAPLDDARLQNVRSMLGVPMTRDGKPFGVIALARGSVEAFTDKQVELVQVFADQAVIAIENVRLINEIRDKSRQLEIASQHKSQFLANMSHELRTPLNAIIGYTEMMADGLYGDMPEKAQTVLERIQANGRHLLGLINDVLDLSKIEAGQLVLAKEAYTVIEMVAAVTAATESLARAKNLQLTSNVAPGLPAGMGDSRRLAQVLLNLVGNAIKFTDQGGVEIRAGQRGDHFDIAVVDTGPGIAPADQAKIFEEFQQVDNTSTRKKGGTGLGLSISRRIVELHGGRITLESEVGKGSTFRISIPINAQPIKDAAE